MAAFKLQPFWNHSAGPKTIHFWTPTFKWGITIANVANFSKPPESLSYPQQLVVYFGATIVVSGLIWARYSTIITSMRLSLYNLFRTVSLGMSTPGIYQLTRKTR
ncbi:hypothetical protein CDL12_12658 [Handroanthus impetiginosus]|uniref:Mitochondrial pyruvate carrier n=1 Tax=Handroanthus impetiginosus TaxID=429701 RepID=A0A2G9HB12_9LAMI|nr:hypothetical protein CDL12_12658 [Handroanthus impetiginosus]